ncbi:chemotaxis protein CheW [Aureimonas sp. SK2]|uniref:chemotaxis protein CheW n=1 Tax=Aureimonas sp. SK2 TaxID=3015992 RepID=UPI0024447D60|nr:chemotaxis protein CheW [Aureimonas sp. SK2]
MTEASTSAENRELIAFTVAGQEFCVDVQTVREIRSYTAATAIPHAPPYVIGVVNLRGMVLPIVDLGDRLGFGRTAPNARSAIIVADIGGDLVGLLVDSMSSIMTVRQDQLQPAPDVASSLAQSFVGAVLAIDDRMISLLSVQGVLPAKLDVAA